MYTSRWEPHWLQFVKHQLPIRQLPAALVGKTLMQVSDVHAGVVDDAYIVDAFTRAAALAPDIVAFTGDFITYHEDEFVRASETYRHFPRGRLATVGILGNHDYGPRWSNPEIADRVAQMATLHGITVLRNQSAVVEGLHIVGRTGTFRYNNADHSIEMGLLLAQKILGYDVDHMSVNTEPEYHEIKQSDKRPRDHRLRRGAPARLGDEGAATRQTGRKASESGG